MSTEPDPTGRITKPSKFPYGKKIGEAILSRVNQQLWDDTREDFIDLYEAVLRSRGIPIHENPRELRRMVKRTGKQAQYTDPHRPINAVYEKIRQTHNFIKNLMIIIAGGFVLLGSSLWISILYVLNIFDQIWMSLLSSPFLLVLLLYIFSLRLNTDFSRMLAKRLAVKNGSIGLTKKWRLRAFYVWNHSLMRQVSLTFILTSLIIKVVCPQKYEFVKKRLITHADIIADPKYGFFRSFGMLLKHERLRSQSKGQ